MDFHHKKTIKKSEVLNFETFLLNQGRIRKYFRGRDDFGNGIDPRGSQRVQKNIIVNRRYPESGHYPKEIQKG